MNVQLPMISYRPEEPDLKKISRKFDTANFFRNLSLICVIISGLLFILSFYFGPARPQKNPEFPVSNHSNEFLNPLCNFRKCRSDAFSQSVFRLFRKNPK